MTNLNIIVWLLSLVVVVVLLVRALGLPSIPGYLLSGVALSAVGIHHTDNMAMGEQLAEFGVVFLMFSIGLEFSLSHLSSMRRLVFGLGLLQVLLTTATVTGIVVAFGQPLIVGVVIGGAISMSSTAVVIKLLSEKLQLDTPHGRDTLGILLFQDLAVVPYLAILPSLHGPTEKLLITLLFDLSGAMVVLVLILWLGQPVMKRWFDLVARRKSEELFMLNVLMVILGLSWLAELASVPLALGAFIAGILIAETDYRHQVAADIRPFRDVLLGLFFVTTGMKVDLQVIGSNFLVVMGTLASMLMVKFALITFLSRRFGSSSGEALRCGLYLAAGGEFGLVMLSQSASYNFIHHDLLQVVLAVLVLSILFAPILIQYSDAIILRLAPSEWFRRAEELTKIAKVAMARTSNIIICGFGRTGQRLAHFLEKNNLTYFSLDIDANRVHEAKMAGEPVMFGNATRGEILRSAGITHASMLVVTYVNTDSALRVLKLARSLNPNITVVVRTDSAADMEKLEAAGATAVIADELESSLMVAAHTLALAGIPLSRIVRQTGSAREQNYHLLRGYFHGASDAEGLDEASHHLKAVTIPDGAYACGKSLQAINLARLNVTLVSLRHQGRRVLDPPPETTLHIGDVVVLHASEDSLRAAENVLLHGA